MTVSVVDSLEIIDIDEDDAEHFFQTLGSFDLFFDGPLHVATVR